MMKLRCFNDEKLFDLLRDSCSKESIFWTEQKSFPESEELVSPAERDEMMAYLLEVCERSDMAFGIETFSLTVTLIDRFLASFKVKSKYLECLSVSCLYIAAKVREEDEKISVTSEFLYDCNSKCSVSELLRMEIMILTKFEWSIDDITAADFLYLFHAILVNKLNDFKNKHRPNQIKNKWNIASNQFKPAIGTDCAYPPTDLDFLHLLEYKLKQLLCNHELVTIFRPRVIAFSLLSVQLEKEQNFNENVQSKPSAKFYMLEAMQIIQQHAKITDDNLNECKMKVIDYLETIDADRNLLDSYMNQYYSEMARNHRANSRLSVTLSSIAKHLTSIKEEDENEEEEKADPSRILLSISNQYKSINQSNLEMATKTCDSNEKKFTALNYADIILGKRDQKRKLSGNSMNEDYELDRENRN